MYIKLVFSHFVKGDVAKMLTANLFYFNSFYFYFKGAIFMHSFAMSTIPTDLVELVVICESMPIDCVLAY